MVGHFDYKHRCLVEKNVPIALILPSKWQDGAESLGMEHTCCLWQSTVCSHKPYCCFALLYTSRHQNKLDYIFKLLEIYLNFNQMSSLYKFFNNVINQVQVSGSMSCNWPQSGCGLSNDQHPPGKNTINLFSLNWWCHRLCLDIDVGFEALN